MTIRFVLGGCFATLDSKAPGTIKICQYSAHMRPAPKIVATVLLAAWLATPAFAQTKGAPNSIMVFGGRATETIFAQTFYAPWTVKLNDLGVVGASYSRRLGTVNEVFGDLGIDGIGDDLTIEAEIGGGFRFGVEELGEVWTALYLRYDGFPWNEKVYTTIAFNTGVSLLMETSVFEVERDSLEPSARLLHYLAPEITIADPENKDLELVVRFHHRSNVFGLVDDVSSGSTFISAGIRMRF
jgi:hypothetical protein